MNATAIYKLSDLADRTPEYALVGEVDLVVVRFDDKLSVFYDRCLHRGTLMSDRHVRGNDLICGVHNWDYRLDSGVSAYANDETLAKFKAWIDGDDICVDADEITAWGYANPQPNNRDADLAGTDICSGEGGMLPEEQAENARYFYKLASAKFGFGWDKLDKVQAFHFRGGQGADAIAASNFAMQAIGCLAMGACHTNTCPVGIATQKPHLVNRLLADKSAQHLTNFFSASTKLMQVMARACGHNHFSKFNHDDLTTWKHDMADISGVSFGGVA